MTTSQQHENKPLISYSWYFDFGRMWTQSDLLKRGWTKSKIHKELDGPDCYGRNPAGGAYVHLYYVHRVCRIERIIGFKDPDPRQAWIHTLEDLIDDFVQDKLEKEKLGTFLLDWCNWDPCFDNGLSPKEALDGCIDKFQLPKGCPVP